GILLGRWGTDPHQAPAEPLLGDLLSRAMGWVEGRPRVLAWGAVSIVVLATAGLSRLKVETDFSRNFRESSSIIRALNFVEQKLGGAGTWEINFSAPRELSEEYLDRVRTAAQKLRDLQDRGSAGIRKVVCLTDGLDLIPTIPFVSSGLKKKRELLRDLQPDFESSLYNAEQGRMRIVLRASERQQATSKHELIDRAVATVRGTFPDAKATGLFVLLTFLIESLLRDQLVSFLLAASGIAVMMAFAFRSVRIGLISLVPNLFPIVLVVGAMGWIGLPINIATAMIASVSMGLTVDSSIHYLSAYRRSRRAGLGVVDALHRTHASVGRALVFANSALIVGFSVLTLSHFIPLVYFGILVSVAMLGGLLGNLLLLPLLLAWLDGKAEDVDEPKVPTAAASGTDRPLQPR
ncbi:MAG TPA: RND family transporter, partial [Planctomycetaceae bacterium]|nr:RND family transporter [Planctomycetaceae bacterium]